MNIMRVAGNVNRQLLASILLVLKASFKSFAVNRNLEIAATLAFYGFLSLMPLLLLTVVVLGMFLRSSDAVASALSQVLSDAIPAFNKELLTDLTSISFNGTIGVISVLLLLWSMTPFSGALRSSVAKMFKTAMRMPFYLSKLIDLATVFSFLLLFLLLSGIKILVPVTPEGAGYFYQFVFFLMRAVVPFVLSVLFIGMFFKVFSPVQLSWHHWLLGAVAVTSLWWIMTSLFFVFVQFNPRFGYAFGSLKAIFLLIVWVYYSFAALLLGAEIMANTYRREALLLKGLLDDQVRMSVGNASLMKKFERQLQPGEVLFREGDHGSEMFVVLEGSIRLSKGTRDLAVMGRGHYFGEMSLLRNVPRSATATAADMVRLAVINKGNFDLLIRENPALVRRLLEELARRLEETNRKLQA